MKLQILVKMQKMQRPTQLVWEMMIVMGFNQSRPIPRRVVKKKRKGRIQMPKHVRFDAHNDKFEGFCLHRICG
jgi:hypothetical protein